MGLSVERRHELEYSSDRILRLCWSMVLDTWPFLWSHCCHNQSSRRFDVHIHGLPDQILFASYIESLHLYWLSGHIHGLSDHNSFVSYMFVCFHIHGLSDHIHGLSDHISSCPLSVTILMHALCRCSPQAFCSLHCSIQWLRRTGVSCMPLLLLCLMMCR